MCCLASQSIPLFTCLFMIKSYVWWENQPIHEAGQATISCQQRTCTVEMNGINCGSRNLRAWLPLNDVLNVEKINCCLLFIAIVLVNDVAFFYIKRT